MPTDNWKNKATFTAATHCAPHHLDELVACALLQRWASEHGRQVEFRFLTRREISAQDLSKYDVLIDIGLTFAAAAGRFDHHQGGDVVHGKSAAGLLFDALFADDPRKRMIAPAIKRVDQIDTQTGPTLEVDDADLRRGLSMTSLSALIKALGGYKPNPAKSTYCVEVISALVNNWFDHADNFIRAEEIVAQGERVGNGLFLPSEDEYGPGLLEYVRTTKITFVGFPTTERFQVVTVRNENGTDRMRFPASLTGASFVHPRGFMAAFPDAARAKTALQTLELTSQ